jgi:hypothetical protein
MRTSVRQTAQQFATSGAAAQPEGLNCRWAIELILPGAPPKSPEIDTLLAQ